MNKIMESLSKILPQDQHKEISEAVDEMLASVKADLEKEANKNLDEAYAVLSKELKEAEQVAEEGYQQAWGIIQDLRNRLETQKTELEAAMEEGYEEAYQMLQTEKAKNSTLETELYETFDKKLQDMKSFMVDKLDEFLQTKGQEIYETAKKDISNDPRMVEHKLALNKIVETVSDYISDEDRSMADHSKLEESKKVLDELKGQMRILEARNVRMSTENTKLSEQVRQASGMLKEHADLTSKIDKKEREQKARIAVGRGEKVTENVKVIGEAQDSVNVETPEQDQQVNEWSVLAGIKK